MTRLGDRLRTEHRALDAHFRDIADHVRAGDPIALDAAWTQLEGALVAHMAFEERHLLPLFERHDADEAAQLRGEHAQIRRRLDELGVAIELHTLREATAEEFLATLRAHAAREDALFYAWADRLPPQNTPAAPSFGTTGHTETPDRGETFRAMA